MVKNVLVMCLQRWSKPAGVLTILGMVPWLVVFAMSFTDIRILLFIGWWISISSIIFVGDIIVSRVSAWLVNKI